jgi:hypothetical protein
LSEEREGSSIASAPPPSSPVSASLGLHHLVGNTHQTESPMSSHARRGSYCWRRFCWSVSFVPALCLYLPCVCRHATARQVGRFRWLDLGLRLDLGLGLGLGVVVYVVYMRHVRYVRKSCCQPWALLGWHVVRACVATAAPQSPVQLGSPPHTSSKRQAQHTRGRSSRVARCLFVASHLTATSPLAHRHYCAAGVPGPGSVRLGRVIYERSCSCPCPLDLPKYPPPPTHTHTARMQAQAQP